MAKDKDNYDLNKKIEGYVAAGNAHNQDWSEVYSDGIDYIYNNQTVHKTAENRKDGFPDIQANYIFPAVMQELSLLAQRRPDIKTDPIEESDKPAAEIWGKVLQWMFDKSLKVKQHLNDATMDGAAYGHWVGYVYWDDKAEWDSDSGQWTGRVKLRLLRPEIFGMDPQAEKPEDALYMYHYRMIPLEDAKEQWPKYAEEIDRAATQLETDMDPEGAIRHTESQLNLKGGTDDNPDNENSGRLAWLLKRGRSRDYDASAAQEKPTHVAVLEMIFRDWETETVKKRHKIPLNDLIASGKVHKNSVDGFDVYVLADTGEELQDGLGNEPGNWPSVEETVTVPKYPNGRRILRVGTDTIIADEAWPMKKWPWVIGRKYPLPHTWHGLNAVEMGKKLQDFVNESYSHLLNNVKQFGDPVVVVEEGVFRKDIKKSLKARAGAIWEVAKNAIGRVRREPAVSIPPSVMNILDRVGQELRDQIGMQEAGIGRGGSNLTATEALRLETNTRMRTALQSLLLDEYTIELMLVVLEFCLFYWDEGRIVRVVGEGESGRTQKITRELLDASFDLKLEVGTSLPYDQERRKNEALQLYQLLGPALLERLLEAYELPDRAAILQAIPAGQLFQEIAAQDGGLEMLQALVDELSGQGDSQQGQDMPVDAPDPESPLPQGAEDPSAPATAEMNNQGLPT